MNGYGYLVLAFCFLFGFWPWILVVIGLSCILGALYVPLVTGVLGAGIFAAMQNQQPYQQSQPYQPYQNPNQPYPSGEEPYQQYEQGYQPNQPNQPDKQPGGYVEGVQQYPYSPNQQSAPQPKQEYDQPQTQYPPKELPPSIAPSMRRNRPKANRYTKMKKSPVVPSRAEPRSTGKKAAAMTVTANSAMGARRKIKEAVEGTMSSLRNSFARSEYGRNMLAPRRF